MVDFGYDVSDHCDVYRTLIRYRRRSGALQGGLYRSLATPAGLFDFVRETEGERLLVALNFAQRSIVANLEGAGRLELSIDPDRPLGIVELESLELGPDEGVIARLG